jgi:hypothetical protein
MEVSGQTHDPAFHSWVKMPLTRSTGGWGGYRSGSKRFQEKYLLALPGIEEVVLTTNLY